MKKAACAIALSAVLVSALCLVGCSSTNLDQEITLEGMTCDIPSDWTEAYNSTDDNEFGFLVYATEDESTTASFMYSSIELDQSTDDAIETYKSTLEGYEDTYSDVSYDEVKSGTVSNCDCTLYEMSYTAHSDEGGDQDIDSAIAYITSPSLRYTIILDNTSGGDSASTLDDILKTVTIEP